MKGFKDQITLHVTLKKNKLKDKAKYTEYAGVILNLVLTNLLKKFYTGSIIGLMKGLDG